jgi:GNAT superfamily N-acetyltransferase
MSGAPDPSAPSGAGGPEALRDLPQEFFAALLRASEDEGYRFVRRVRTEWDRGSSTFSEPGEVLVGVAEAGQLVAIGGLMRDPYAGDPSVGRLRNVYVMPACRQRGLGTAIVGQLMERAASSFRMVRLRAGSAGAARLYERFGFRPVEGVAECTHILAFPARPAAPGAS